MSSIRGKRATWFVPSLIKGSGGHRTILQHAAYMRQMGCEVEICLEDRPIGPGSPADRIAALFGYHFDNVRTSWLSHGRSDFYFATIWYSARFVHDIPGDARKFYFVQDYEPLFNPMGDEYLEAENSYTYGLTPITIGRWLSHELQARFEAAASCFDFCADQGVYRQSDDTPREKAVCFIFQPEKPRRCAVMGLQALRLVKREMPEVKIYSYGSEAVVPDPDIVHLGLLSLPQCAELYSKCTLGLCISASNPSRIPFEMMSCGLPVVEIHRDNNLYDLPDEAALLAHQDSESLAAAMLEVLRDPPTAARMSESALAFMSGRSIEHGLEQFVERIEEVISAEVSAPVIGKLYTKPALKVEKGTFPKLDLIVLHPSAGSKLKLLVKRFVPGPMWHALRAVKLRFGL